MMMALSGCYRPSAPKQEANSDVSSSGTPTSGFQYTELLSLDQFKTALFLQGLQLSDNQEANPAGYQIYNVNPAIYSIKHSNQVLLVYVFRSIEERIQASGAGGSGFFLKTQFPQKENCFSRTYAIRNVLMIVMVDVSMMHSIPEIERVLRPLQNVFLSLNDSQKAVFADKGTYWDARYVVDYYQHWYKDDRGTTHHDQYSNGKWAVKYIGPDPQSIRDIKYEYKTPGEGGSGDGILEKIGEDYCLRLANNERGDIPDKDTVCTITIQWDGKEESFKLIKTE